MYFFLGPTPAEVVQQYTEVGVADFVHAQCFFFQLIGRPYFPPYWALGFHLCRWGYRSANKTWAVVKRMRELQIPQVRRAPPTLCSSKVLLGNNFTIISVLHIPPYSCMATKPEIVVGHWTFSDLF